MRSYKKSRGGLFHLSQYKSYRTCGEHHSNEVNVSVRRIPPEYPPKPSLGVQHSGRGPNMLSIAAFVAAYVVAIAVHEARPGVYSSRETVLSCPRDTRDVTVYLCAAHAEMLLRHSGYYACDARLSLCSGLVPCVACGCAFSPGHGVNMIVYHVVSCTPSGSMLSSPLLQPVGGVLVVVEVRRSRAFASSAYCFFVHVTEPHA